MGWYLRSVGVIALDREKGDVRAMRTAIQLLKGGAVLPVYVHGSYEAWSKSSGGLKHLPITVMIGRLITREEIQRLGTGREAYVKIGELIMERIAESKAGFEKLS